MALWSLLGPRPVEVLAWESFGEGWVTERLVYTHGFGAVLSPANDVTGSGRPDFYVKDIPPLNSTDDPSLPIGSWTLEVDSAATSFIDSLAALDPTARYYVVAVVDSGGGETF